MLEHSARFISSFRVQNSAGSTQPFEDNPSVVIQIWPAMLYPGKTWVHNPLTTLHLCAEFQLRRTSLDPAVCTDTGASTYISSADPDVRWLTISTANVREPGSKVLPQIREPSSAWSSPPVAKRRPNLAR